MFALLLFLVGALFHQTSCHPKVANVGIYGGHVIPIEKAPYMVSQRVRFYGGEWIHNCGASIIHERFVLTAAHCTRGETSDSMKILVGSSTDDGNNGRTIDVEKVWSHSDFGGVLSGNDIALIKLKEPLSFGPKVKKINIANDSLILPNKTKLNAAGWGNTDTQRDSDKLHQVEMPLISHAECDKIFGFIKDSMICAGDRGLDTCQGDSGGPLNFGDVQVGITSFGYGCSRIPGVYTKVAAYHSWITERMSPYEL